MEPNIYAFTACRPAFTSLRYVQSGLIVNGWKPHYFLVFSACRLYFLTNSFASFKFSGYGTKFSLAFLFLISTFSNTCWYLKPFLIKNFTVSHFLSLSFLGGRNRWFIKIKG